MRRSPSVTIMARHSLSRECLLENLMVGSGASRYRNNDRALTDDHTLQVDLISAILASMALL